MSKVHLNIWDTFMTIIFSFRTRHSKVEKLHNPFPSLLPCGVGVF